MCITNKSLSMIAIVLMLVSSSLMAASDIYRWVDEDGVVHFSEQPPANNEATKVDTRAMSFQTVEAEADTITAAESYNPVEDELVEEEVTPAEQIREERATAREVAAAEKERLETNCKNADYIISRLQPTPDVLVTDEDGNVTRMDDNVRLEKLREAQEYAQANCNS